MESKSLQEINSRTKIKQLIKDKLRENLQNMIDNLKEGMLLDISKMNNDIENIKVVNPLSIPYEIIKSKNLPIVSDNLDSYLKFIDIMGIKEIFQQDIEYITLSNQTEL